MEYTVLVDLRYAQSSRVGMAIFEEMFKIFHQTANGRKFALDFPFLQRKSGAESTASHATLMGHQLRAFGEKRHLDTFIDALWEPHKDDRILFPEGDYPNLVEADRIVGYAQIQSKRPRKSAAKAEQRFRAWVERTGKQLERPITQGTLGYQEPTGPYLRYQSTREGAMRFYLRRSTLAKKDAPQNVFDGQNFDSFGFSRKTPEGQHIGWVPVLQN